MTKKIAVYSLLFCLSSVAFADADTSMPKIDELFFSTRVSEIVHQTPREESLEKTAEICKDYLHLENVAEGAKAYACYAEDRLSSLEGFFGMSANLGVFCVVEQNNKYQVNWNFGYGHYNPNDFVIEYNNDGFQTVLEGEKTSNDSIKSSNKITEKDKLECTYSSNGSCGRYVIYDQEHTHSFSMSLETLKFSARTQAKTLKKTKGSHESVGYNYTHGVNGNCLEL